MQSPATTFHIRTYGCQMNERDSEALAFLLESLGYRETPDELAADILVLNTCSVRAQAEHKVLGKLGILKRHRAENPNRIVGVVGCMAQNYGERLLEKIPHVDFVLGTHQLERLPEVLEAVVAGKHGIVLTDMDGGVRSPVLNGHRPGSHAAFVAVMHGCNQFCTYCIVPHVRGREVSRPATEIVDEVRRLADQGVKEVTLLGQNVTAYGLAEARRQTTHCRGDSPFADLLETLHPIEGIRRIRFTSPHPRDMNERFIATVTTLPKVCNAFHVPLQSGSDRILELMHRGYTVGQYLDVIDGLRRAGPDTTLSTDVIVGFPSETEDEFLQTKAVMERVRYDMAYVFKYSPREGTRAARDLEDDVDKDEKLRRNHVLLETLEAGVATANERYVGMDVEVLVEGASPRNPETWCGRTRNSKVCIFPPVPGLHPGDLVTVRIDRVTSHSLFGTAAGAPAS